MRITIAMMTVPSPSWLFLLPVAAAGRRSPTRVSSPLVWQRPNRILWFPITPGRSITVYIHYCDFNLGCSPLRRQGRLRMKDEETAEDEYPAIIRCLLRESGKLSFTSLKEFLDFDLKMAARYLCALWRAVEVRVKAENCGDDPTHPIGVLFSGGIGLHRASCHCTLRSTRHHPY
ncbi:hypothetical protein C3747_13g308 [Trypanosoma cruzi]|uniref:Uncharacterized protein n=1 Tax=Trypanosoma cruzi TaxID=5693 RepID=A0A2V2XEI3_TRYCR|nr:hypothetical protein C3747_13g308 [Trypanosoma cruzi]